MFLIDTNIWVERLLHQEKSEIVGQFLNRIPSEQLFISDFALHSIGVILSRLKKYGVFLQFIDDLFKKGSVCVVTLEAVDMPEVITAIETFNLDFDDAYQYIAAQKNSLTIVSFDKDFDNEPHTCTPFHAYPCILRHLYIFNNLSSISFHSVVVSNSLNFMIFAL